ncbi:MAG: helix-turn-helix domain-containing protein [Gallionella sp.]|nr:helix-turn-helix domain-containing protein [Gallionella sp.]
MIPTQIPKETLRNREEAASYLGISPSTLANWACTKKYKIPYFKVGRSVRYRQSDLDAFVQNGEVD